jgi:diguanylate cyclase (GGDEF)-like protein/PAS domain S-box-containing protein
MKPASTTTPSVAAVSPPPAARPASTTTRRRETASARPAQTRRKQGRQTHLDTLREILEEVPFPVAIFQALRPGGWGDADSSVLLLNRSYRQLLGWEAGEVRTLGDLTEKLYPDPAYREQIVRWRREVAALDENQRRSLPPRELQAVAKDGSKVEVTAGTAAVGDLMVVVLQDITRSKLVETHLRESEALMRLILGNMPFPVTISTVKGHPRVTFLNRQFTQVYGYEATDVPTLEQWIGVACPDDSLRAGLAAWLAGAVSQSQQDSRPVMSDEIPVCTKDGAVKTVVMSAIVVGQSLIVASHDITDRKAAEEKLRERERELEAANEHYRLLLENSTDVVVHTDNDGAIQWVTPSLTGLLGWTPEEVQRRNYRDLVHADDLALVAPLHGDVRQGAPGQVDIRLKTRLGGYHWVSMRISPIRDRRGRVVGRVAGIRDIQQEVTAREAIDAERRRLKATIDSMLDAHVVLRPIRGSYGKVVDFMVADANHAACVGTNLTREHMVGRRLIEVLPGLASGELPSKFAETLDNGNPLVLNDQLYPGTDGRGESHFDLRAVKIGESVSLTWRDVTERYRAARQLAQSEEHYRLLSLNAYDTVIRVNDAGIMTWVSPSIRSILGHEPEDLVGRRVAEFLAAEMTQQAVGTMQRLADEDLVIERFRVRSKAGQLHWAESFARPYINARGERDGIVVSFHLIDQQVAAELELERRARTDELTRLLNRREVLERLEGLRGLTARTGQRLAVLFVDFDRFKAINDTHGHAAGDAVLRTTADRLRACLRSSDDLGARVGGDELMIVLRGVHGLADAVAVAEKLRQSAAEPVVVRGVPIEATVSIGVTLARPNESTDALVARADAAMYQAKQKGRNQIITIEPPPDDAPVA